MTIVPDSRVLPVAVQHTHYNTCGSVKYFNLQETSSRRTQNNPPPTARDRASLLLSSFNEFSLLSRTEGARPLVDAGREGSPRS